MSEAERGLKKKTEWVTEKADIKREIFLNISKGIVSEHGPAQNWQPQGE